MSDCNPEANVNVVYGNLWIAKAPCPTEQGAVTRSFGYFMCLLDKGGSLSKSLCPFGYFYAFFLRAVISSRAAAEASMAVNHRVTGASSPVLGMMVFVIVPPLSAYSAASPFARV